MCNRTLYLFAGTSRARLCEIKSSAGGFTLVELLVVMAIGLILATLSILSISGVSSSRSLVSGGNQVVDLINEARQNSISGGTLTALIMVSNSGNSQLDNRAFILASMDSSGSTPVWSAISKWEILPQGVVVNTSLGSFADPSATPTNLSTVPLQYMGGTIPFSKTLYQVFFPDGHILANSTSSPAAPVIYLVPGVMQGNSVVSTAAGGNYYEITINPYTGTPIVDRK